MDIRLGNLSIIDIETIYKIIFTEEDKKWLNEHRQEDVSIPINADKWHCFDCPKVLVCGSFGLANELYGRLKVYKFQDSLEIALEERR